MRIIDSDAINKRVFADIANTFQHSQKITGEKTVQGLSGTDEPKAAAVDNFNFNGIEFSKVKQLINYIQTHKKEFYFDEQLVEITNNKKEITNFFIEEGDTDEDETPSTTSPYILNKRKGLIINDYKKQFVVPDSFDGRNSFILPSFVLVPKTTREEFSGDLAYNRLSISNTVSLLPDCYTNGSTIEVTTTSGSENAEDFLTFADLKSGNNPWIVQNALSLDDVVYKYPFFYKPDFIKSMRFGLTEKANIFDHKEFIHCWAASMDDSDGNNCLMVDKNKNLVTITASVNLSNKNIGFDRSGGGRFNELNSPVPIRDNCIARVYLHVLFVYWRDK